MSRLFVPAVAIATLVAAVPSLAADMPVKAPPRSAITTSWAGVYVGAFVGYGMTNTAGAVPDAGLDGRFIGIGGKGFVAGGLVGYNVMLSPRWLTGIEVDAGWQDIKSHLTAPFGVGNGQAEIRLGWSASIRGRLGYLVTPTTMLFGTVGWSWSEIEGWQQIYANESASRSVNGAQIGFGVETMYDRNWIVRTEYTHTFYDTVQYDSVSYPGTVRASPWVGVIRSALIYKPGPTSSTAWPDRAPNPVWTGFYVGGLVGPLMATAKLTMLGTTVDGVGVTAVVPALIAGYNIALAPRWIAGIEGEIAPNISTSDVDIQWTGAVRARVGYLLTPTVMAYGSLGWGTAGIGNITHPQLGGTIPVERVHAIGYGTGIEAAITDAWRLRADYQFYWTNNVDIVLPGIPVTIKATAQTARLGAIYAFGGR